MRLIARPDQDKEPFSAIVTCGIQEYDGENHKVPGCGWIYKVTIEDIFSLTIQEKKFLKVNCWRCANCRKTHTLQSANDLSVPEETTWLKLKKKEIVKALMKYSSLEDISNDFLLSDDFLAQL